MDDLELKYCLSVHHHTQNSDWQDLFSIRFCGKKVFIANWQMPKAVHFDQYNVPLLYKKSKFYFPAYDYILKGC